MEASLEKNSSARIR
ncbi:hypothetical protein LINPERPRIM_LOCUS35867 [Linum perenne]